MELDINVYHHFDATSPQLDRIEAMLAQLVTMEATQMADLTALATEVQENGDAVASAVSLLNGLSTALNEAIASNDPAAIQAIADQLDANTQSLADAVVANTPAAGPPQ